MIRGAWFAMKVKSVELSGSPGNSMNNNMSPPATRMYQRSAVIDGLATRLDTGAAAAPTF
jgi:hypothetical protein